MDATLTVPMTQNDLVREVISEQFAQRGDGMWYPVAAGDALVRIRLESTGYRVERRRKPTAAWTAILTATLAEFEAEAFRTWASRWPLVTP